MSSGLKKPVKRPMPLTQSSNYNSLYVNPLVNNIQLSKHHHSGSEGGLIAIGSASTDNKENNPIIFDKENQPKPIPIDGSVPVMPDKFKFSNMKSLSTNTSRLLKPTSLQYCMQMSEPDKGFNSKSILFDFESENSTSSLKIWDFSDSESAPASSWSTLPNRTLLCRPLPLDIGKCTCIIVKEKSPQGFKGGGSIYSLYTNEGQGRQNRKLATAHHKWRKGKSVFSIAQDLKGIMCNSDDSFVGNVTANFIGSQYHIWDQMGRSNLPSKQRNPLLAVVTFVPTVVTCTGSYRSMRVFIPKHQSMQFKNNAQVQQHINGLPKDWIEKMDKVHKLYSRTPHYNNFSRQYELDYRDRGRAGLKVQRSVKNFQLKLEENGKQTILQLGKVGKSKFVMDFRYPLSGYQAFSICLASIDSKLCCTV